ncbi:MAG TPA: hypothetical protein VIG64_08015, partial [Actinomycetota bacterium]
NADGTNQRALATREAGFNGYGSFSWSPDSTRIAASGLIVVDASTGAITRLDPGNEPDWSPASDEIAFEANGIHAVEPDGSARRQIVPPPASRPSWSPDGDEIAYVLGRGGGQPGQVYVADADGSEVRQVSTSGAFYITPAWSPDGERLAFTGSGYALHVVNADGTGEDRIGDYGYSSDPAWCPDGTLYFTAQDGDSEYGIYALSTTGNHALVTPGVQPDCSLDGKIAFARSGDIHVMVPGQAGEPQLTTTEDRSEFRPQWSPDGSKIAYYSLGEIPPPTTVDRTITLSLEKHLVARGEVSPGDGRCRTFVRIQKMTTNGWKTLEERTSRSDNLFRTKLPDRPGLYRAVAPSHASAFHQYLCQRAKSEIVKHTHRPPGATGRNTSP